MFRRSVHHKIGLAAVSILVLIGLAACGASGDDQEVHVENGDGQAAETESEMSDGHGEGHDDGYGADGSAAGDNGDSQETAGSGEEAGEAGAEGVTVEITNFAFQPQELTVAAGTEITFTNLDSVAHTATDRGGAFDSGSLAQNESYTVTLTEPGEYEIYCIPHPDMVAIIIVE